MADDHEVFEHDYVPRVAKGRYLLFSFFDRQSGGGMNDLSASSDSPSALLRWGAAQDYSDESFQIFDTVSRQFTADFFSDDFTRLIEQFEASE